MKFNPIKIILAIVLLNIILFLFFYQVESIVTEGYQELEPTIDTIYSPHTAKYNLTYNGADMEPRVGGGKIRVDYYEIKNLENENFCLDYTARVVKDGTPVCGSIFEERLCLRQPITNFKIASQDCGDFDSNTLDLDYEVEPFFKNIPTIDYEVTDTHEPVNKTKETVVTESLGKSILRKILRLK